MAYDERLADRIRSVLSMREEVAERHMFGGVAFMVGGHMACGVSGSELMVRLGDEGADAGLDEPHTRPMDFTGRPMKGYLFVEPAGIADDEGLQRWVDRAVAFTESLPPKQPKRR